MDIIIGLFVSLSILGAILYVALKWARAELFGLWIFVFIVSIAVVLAILNGAKLW